MGRAQDGVGWLAYCGAVDGRCSVLRAAVSRGSRYTLGNIVPACESCNASKCNDEVTGWLRRRRFDERTFLVRHLEIKTALALQSLTSERRSGGGRPTAPRQVRRPYHGRSADMSRTRQRRKGHQRATMPRRIPPRRSNTHTSWLS